MRCFAFQPGAQSSALDRLLCEGFHTARMSSLTIPGVNLQHKEFRSFSVCINQVRNQVRIGKQTLKGLQSLRIRGGVYTPAGSTIKVDFTFGKRVFGFCPAGCINEASLTFAFSLATVVKYKYSALAVYRRLMLTTSRVVH